MARNKGASHHYSIKVYELCEVLTTLEHPIKQGVLTMYEIVNKCHGFDLPARLIEDIETFLKTSGDSLTQVSDDAVYEVEQMD